MKSFGTGTAIIKLDNLIIVVPVPDDFMTLDGYPYYNVKSMTTFDI